MRTILQHDERDCGAACLAMVADYYGYSDSIKKFRELTNTDQAGVSFDDMINAANSIGLSAEGLSGNIDELCDGVARNEIRFPFIAHVTTEDDLYHFVVVTKLDSDICIYDPAKGRVNVTMDAFAGKWTGNILTLSPTDSFQKHKKMSCDLLTFFSLLKGQEKRFLFVVLISALISCIGILGAFMFQLVIDHSSEILEAEVEIEHGMEHHEHDIEFLTASDTLNKILEEVACFFGNLSTDGVSKLFACLVALYIFAAVIQYVRDRLIIEMSKQIDQGLTLPYFNRIMDLPVSSVLKRKTGEYMSRYSDLAAIRNAISTATITIILDTMMAAGCGVILYFQSSRLFLIAVIMITIYSIIVLVNSKRIKDSNRVFMENNAYIHSYIKESIDGVQTIKSANAEEQMKRTMASKFSSYLEAAIKKSRILIVQDVLVTVIETVGISVILWQGFSLVIRGRMTLGTLITFYALLGYLISPIKNLIGLQPVIQSAVVAAERLRDILDMKEENKAGKDMRILTNIDEWGVKDLNFRYGHQDMLLKGLNFSFQKGEKIAVIGESGSGKTTLAKLFARFYEPESGGIYADGIPLKEYSVDSLRNVIAYVSNETCLFSGTLEDNLTLGKCSCSEKELTKVCKITGVSELIEQLPGGLQFRIEEGGANLSSGQKQRITIVRALLKNPQLLILDEATANLDSGVESDIIEAIKKYNPKLAIMMITHRISTIKNYDKIIVLRDGKVCGREIYEEILDNCSA